MFKSIQVIAKHRSTYSVGLLQTKAYRVLKQFTAKELEAYALSTVDWALLGLLYDKRAGLRATQLALELGVEAPFVTTLFSKLKKMDFVTSKSDVRDSRVKIIYLTDLGIETVVTIERTLQHSMKKLIKGTSLKEIASYITVLETLIKNSNT